MSENNSILILGSLLSPICTSKNTTGRVNPDGASGGLDILLYVKTMVLFDAVPSLWSMATRLVLTLQKSWYD
jgi:hypothetical protein